MYSMEIPKLDTDFKDMATKDDKDMGQLGLKLKSQNTVNRSTDQSMEYSRAAKSPELLQPSLSYSEYEKLPKEVVDNVLETNLCCLKALLHYSGFELLSESPDLEIQCRLCKMKLQTDNDEYDLDRPKNKMRCGNTNHGSLEAIVFNHLRSSRSKAMKENESSSEHSVLQMSESEYEEALDSYEPNVFNHKELLGLVLQIINSRKQMQTKLQEKTSELEEKEQVIKEQDSELKLKGETLVKIRTDYTKLEKYAIPKLNENIQEKEDYQVTIQKLKVMVEERGVEVLHLKDKNSLLEQLYQDCKKNADFLQNSFTKEQEKCAGLEIKNQTLEALVEGFQRINISSEGNEQGSLQEQQEVNTNQNAGQSTSKRGKKNKKRGEASSAKQRPDQTDTTSQLKKCP